MGDQRLHLQEEIVLLVENFGLVRHGDSRLRVAHGNSKKCILEEHADWTGGVTSEPLAGNTS